MKSRHTFCIASLLVMFSLLSDQLLAEEKAEEQQASKVIECSFLHWGDVPEEKLFFRMGEEYHPMTFRVSARAGKISLKRMAEFEIFRELVFISPPERRGSDTPRVKFISQLVGKPLAEAGQ